jgi:Amino acid permease
LQTHFTSESLGWLEGTIWPTLAGVGLLIAFGHSLLAMSGFETLAQVYREIAAPKMKNLIITGNMVCIYAMISTGLISFFAVMIIPDNVRPQYYDNLIGGLSMSLIGPPLLKLAFHVFVVIVGILILSGAVNTSLIGANGILNRVAEDGVLLTWFRRPHRKFGTTSRIIDLIALLQLATILFSMGDVFLLGEAYAFGVVWSFTLKGIGVLALRFQRHDQEYKTPLNLHVGKIELPIGLAATTLMLLLVAIANLFTKKIATIYGLSFTLVLMVLFIISDKWNARRAKKTDPSLEEFNIVLHDEAAVPKLALRPGCILVAVRNYVRLTPLLKVLHKTNLRRHDIVVMTVRNLDAGVGEYDLADDQIFTDYEQELFSHVVEAAEKEGKPVDLLVVPSAEPFIAMVRTAVELKASRLVLGLSPNMKPEELAQLIGLAWEKLPEPKQSFSLEIVDFDGTSRFVDLGPHPPRLWPEDLDLLHQMWLQLADHDCLGPALHHRDIVGYALRRMEKDLASEQREKVLEELKHDVHL